MNRLDRFVLFPLLLLFATILVSCGKNDDATNPPVPTTGPATATITSAGGTVTAQAEDGTIYHLVVPEGAARGSSVVTVRPLAPSGEQLAMVALEPAGLMFRKPFELTVTLPEGRDPTDAGLRLESPVGDTDPVHVPTVVNPSARTLTASLTIFGMPVDSTYTLAKMDPLGFQSASDCEGGNVIVAQPINCAFLVQSAQQSVDALVAQGAFCNALHLALETGTLLQNGDCPGVEDVVAMIKDVACQGLAAAIADAAAIGTSNFGDFERTVAPIILWAGLANKYSQDCSNLGAYLTQVEGEIQDWMVFFDGRLQGLGENDFSTFLDLKQEAVSAFEMQIKAELLTLNEVSGEISLQAFLPAVDRMREVAYTLCERDAWHYPLSRMTSTGFFAARDIVGVPAPRPGTITAPDEYARFSNEDIHEDLQFCATALQLEALATSGGAVDTTRAGGQGSPGQAVKEVTITTPTRGKLSLGGEVWGFTGWDDDRLDEELAVKLAGNEVLVLRRPIGGHEYVQGTPGVIDIETAAQEAGISPREGTTHELTVTRRRTTGDYRLWGDTETELLSATLEWKNPTLAVVLDFPAELAEDGSAPLQVDVDMIDQLGVAGPAAETDVTVTVTGGSASPSSGTTDANGRFTTSVSAGPGSQGLTIRAAAASEEGATAEATRTASVASCPATDHYLEEDGSGNYTADARYGYAKATATSSPGTYNYGEATWTDDFAVLVDDPALNGQTGKVHLKVRYKFTRQGGASQTSPSARVVIGPRNGYQSPFFFVINRSGSFQDDEQEWEVPITCSFNRSSAPLDVRAEVYARAPDDQSVTLTAEIRWLGITRVTTADGTEVSGYTICTGSGTDYSGAPAR